MLLRVEPTEHGPDRTHGSGPAQHVLALVVERQERADWCWAAVACSVARFWGCHDWSQERVAAATPRPGQPSSGSDFARLDDALSAVGCFDHWSPGHPGFARLATEIAVGRPVGVQVQAADFAHFVLVIGYHRGRRELQIADPAHGPSVQPCDRFPICYPPVPGFWQGTYWTRPPVNR
ncbi:papain-like cysteine protease family protein [Saccharopolyspora hirsuta]|uniref:Peptidase C39-like domain-containing protein n=1 Tax=Saccharopolyspora hirsuta TaxID=1837 RepID=A0A5M7BUE7_SACHI|nr:papain-like cysteine protease family protein [Saccharopolyspora hirsuta]KAA5831778.1 hypothetical protein F1721_18215 [Saccharopolyspora hirsuta]